MRSFLAAKGHAADQIDGMHTAWLKAEVLPTRVAPAVAGSVSSNQSYMQFESLAPCRCPNRARCG
jgi:hypothetical protein